ncbi:MAG TPA: hypothetical protein VGJ59_13960, partial [Jatrophihabitantaceae bacterium]
VKTTQQAPSPVGPLTVTMLAIEETDRAFMVGYSDFPAGWRVDLNNAAHGAAVLVHGQATDLHRVSPGYSRRSW